MKRLCTVLFVILFTVSAQAQTKQQSIKTLLGLMMQDSLIDKMYDNMAAAMTSQFSTQYKDNIDEAKIKETSARVMQISKNIAKKMLNEEFVAIYDKNFTEQEIKDFIQFYKTPSGRQMIRKMPDVQKDIMTAMTQKYAPMMQEEIIKAYSELVPTKDEKTN